MHIIAAQADKLADKALDTIVQAIQGGLVGVAIILASAIITLAIVLVIVIRSSNRNIMELLKFNGRLATSIEKMDETLDKMTIQQSQQNMLFAELTATLRQIPEMYKKMLEEMGLVRTDVTGFTKVTDGIVTKVQGEIQDLMVILDRRLGEISGKLQKIKPDTQPIPIISSPAPAALPEPTVSDLLTNHTKTDEA